MNLIGELFIGKTYEFVLSSFCFHWAGGKLIAILRQRFFLNCIGRFDLYAKLSWFFNDIWVFTTWFGGWENLGYKIHIFFVVIVQNFIQNQDFSLPMLHINISFTSKKSSSPCEWSLIFSSDFLSFNLHSNSPKNIEEFQNKALNNRRES